MISAIPNSTLSPSAHPYPTAPLAADAPFEQGWVPKGYVGPVALPGTGRIVFWTGRIAIGLRWAPAGHGMND